MHIGSSTGVFSNTATPGVAEPKLMPEKSSVAIEEKPFSPVKEPAETGARQALQSQNKQTEDVAHQQKKDKKAGEQQQRIEEQEKQQQLKEQEIIRELAQRDREVRAHERAHSSVGGQYAGGPVYQHKRGPNGVSYAVSGEVRIDTSPVAGNPQATLQKAETVQRAALAPADPSAQDRLVAGKASQIAVEARAEIASQRNEVIDEDDAEDTDKSDVSKEGKEAEDKKVMDEQKRQEELREEELKRQETFKRRGRELNKTLADLTLIDEPASIGYLLDSVV